MPAERGGRTRAKRERAERRNIREKSLHRGVQQAKGGLVSAPALLYRLGRVPRATRVAPPAPSRRQGSHAARASARGWRHGCAPCVTRLYQRLLAPATALPSAPQQLPAPDEARARRVARADPGTQRAAPRAAPRNARRNPRALLCDADAPPAAQMGGIRPMVVCGPSGVGKGTLIAKLMARVPRLALAFCRPRLERGLAAPPPPFGCVFAAAAG